MLTPADLYSLEQYSVMRAAFRDEIRAYKKNRQVALGNHATLYFEDQRTIHYQIQEILRVERIFEADAIAEELEAYNPLIPDGNNWKATFMLEYEVVEERKAALARMVGIEDQVWVQVAGHDKVMAIANEDLKRSTAEKTSAVHFLRFQLSPEMITTAKQGAAISMGVAHPAYWHQVEAVSAATQQALVADLQFNQ